MRRALTVLVVLAAAAGGAGLLWMTLESFRVKGGVPLRTRDRAGRTWTSSDTLTHGEKTEAVRWLADYEEEVLEAAEGRPTKVRRKWVNFEKEATGVPRPEPLADVVVIDAAGVKEEATGQPWKKLEVTFPDPFAGILPAKDVYMSSEWTVGVTAAAAVAKFLGRSPAVTVAMEAKLDEEVARDGVKCLRIRVKLQSKLEDGRFLDVQGDLYFVRSEGFLGDVEWLGYMSDQRGDVKVHFLRTRKLRRP